MGMNDDRIIAEFQAMVFNQKRESNICDFDFETISEEINLKDLYLNIQLKVWDIKSANSTRDEKYRLRNNGNISTIIPTGTTILL